MTAKPRRFFYHFNKARRAMTVHFMGTCYIVQNVVCRVPCETKWQARQPRLVMRGFAHTLAIDPITSTGILE
jgi:hypothetical protein